MNGHYIGDAAKFQRERVEKEATCSPFLEERDTRWLQAEFNGHCPKECDVMARLCNDDPLAVEGGVSLALGEKREQKDHQRKKQP
jgi:hypothetical protein